MDMRHMYKMVNWENPAHNIVILDDTNCTAAYCLECNRLWQRYKEGGLLQELFCSNDGVNHLHGHCVGRFLHNNK